MPTLQMGVGLEYGDYTRVGDKGLPSNSLCLMAIVVKWCEQAQLIKL